MPCLVLADASGKSSRKGSPAIARESTVVGYRKDRTTPAAAWNSLLLVVARGRGVKTSTPRTGRSIRPTSASFGMEQRYSGNDGQRTDLSELVTTERIIAPVGPSGASINEDALHSIPLTSKEKISSASATDQRVSEGPHSHPPPSESPADTAETESPGCQTKPLG